MSASARGGGDIIEKRSSQRIFMRRAENNYGRHRDNAEPSKAGEGPPRLTINIIFVRLMVRHFSGKKDKGSSANIIQWRVLEQAKLTRSIIPATKRITGFYLASVTTRGEILLPANAEGVMKTTLFEVVDDNMGYNIILERPWLHEMKAVLSIYHQFLKFPTPEEIKQIRGDLPTVREINAISLSSGKEKEHAS
uniref:Uncharacterized protein n=1 Tax=Nicotiana tabacum TaxID=4097 RepID=A0A1S4B149_TOBAC|nr:PREDICTED: uncharacterized protein LOC107803387 [Nicotiana tabacum]